MNRLTLNLDELRVDSFQVNDPERKDGATHAWSDDSVCPTTAPSERRPCN
jgi:hypothetical protein